MRSRYAAINRIAKKRHLVKYKGGQCQDCEGSFPMCCYHFDHRIPEEKSFEISNKMTMDIEALMVEVDKCDLVCANCHAIRTTKSYLVSEKRQSRLISAMHRKRISEAQKIRVRLPLSQEHKDRIAHGVSMAAFRRKKGEVSNAVQ